jgi:phosphoribosylaminoimidazole-succinocarboxamide synthase
LGSRQALTQPKPNYECPEQGRVIVKVYVDRTGTVVDAIPGENIPNGGGNSTTSSKCLFQKAKDAAMKTKWQGDANAPVKQVGLIIYNFTKN